MLITMSIALIGLFVASCKQPASKENTQQKSPTTKLSRYTLNGIPYSDANKMIQSFTGDMSMKDEATSILFTDTTFHSMDSLLNADGADGLRIYFAKDTTSKSNTVVIVSTFDGGIAANDTNHIHRDYFQYNEPYLSTSTAKRTRGIPSYGTKVDGALLFTDPKCSPKDTCKSAYHYITCTKAQGMVKAFTSQSVTTKINANSEWFDIGIINDLDTLLQKTPKSGLRIYFAKHLDKDSQGVYRDGFVLITTQNNSGTQTDNYICLPVHPKYRNPFGGTGGGTDNGEQCPTNCSGSTWP